MTRLVINTVYHFVDSNLGELRYPQKRGVDRKRGEEFWKLFCLGRGQMIHPWEGRVCLGD